MKQCLVDVNVWMALLVASHEHHAAAGRWYASANDREAGLCRFVQLGVVRLLSNAALLQSRAVTPRKAWGILGELLQDARVEFVEEPSGIDITLPDFLDSKAASTKKVSDAYLAAFAFCSSRRMVTLDKGFRQFRDLDVVSLV